MTAPPLFTHRRRFLLSGDLVRGCRFVGRYAIATVMIPLSVMLGVFGLGQHAWRRKVRRHG
jgi:hypothetical protein